MTKRFATFNLLALICFPFAARASLITGTVNFSGTIELSLGSIAFIDNAFTINSPASTQVGEFVVLEGTTGTIQNIVNPPDATGSLDVPDFMTFSAAPNITFALTFLQPGIDGAAGCTSTPPAAGQVCTPDVPAQSPLNFQNTSSATSTISFVLQGLEFDSLTATTIPINGIFTMQVSNMNFQEVLGEVEGGETVPFGFSASFSTGSPSPSVPEPNTWTAIAIGAAGWACVTAGA